MEASDRQAGNIKNPNGKSGLNAVCGKHEERRCYRCDQTGYKQDDKRCPARSKECLKCHKVGHFAKCCKTKKPRSLLQKNSSRPKDARETKRTVNQMKFEDHPDSDNDYAFTIVDDKQPMALVNVGGVPNITMIVDSGASCNVIDRQLWELLKQN